MPKRDKQYMMERREEILDATMKCLGRSGLAGLSTTEICTEAGISMGALYTHFDSKDDILQALAVRSTRRRQEKLEFANFAALRRHFIEMMEPVITGKSHAAFRVDLELVLASSSDAKRVKLLQPLRDTRPLANAISALKAAGEVKLDVDPDAAATALDAIVWGANTMALIGGRSPALYRASLALLLDSLAA
jgi:AcrR family transcriptional regulator